MDDEEGEMYEGSAGHYGPNGGESNDARSYQYDEHEGYSEDHFNEGQNVGFEDQENIAKTDSYGNEGTIEDCLSAHFVERP